MTLPILTIGDDFDNTATLKTGSPAAAYDVSSATSIKAIVTSEDSSQAYCSEVTLSSAATGADWANGVVVLSFSAAVTAEIATHVTKPTIGRIEIQVEINSKKYTWTSTVMIRPGNIS